MKRTLDKDAMRAAREDKGALIDALELAGAKIIKASSFCCPFHDDTNPSARIKDKDGVWRFDCYRCALHLDVWDVRARNAGRDLADVLPMIDTEDQKKETNKMADKPATVWNTLEEMAADCARWKNGEPEANYIFTDEAGKPVMVEMRIKIPGDKTCMSGRPHGNGWTNTLPPGPRPLYNLPEVVKSPYVVVVEGPRKVELLRSLGIVATSSGNGFQSTKNFNWSPLSTKRVLFWRDNDAQGLQYQRDATALLNALTTPPESIGYVDVDKLPVALPVHGDVVDFCEMISGDIETKRKAVREVLRASAPPGPARALAESIESQIAGRSALVAFPGMTALTKATRALMPGSVLMLAGHPGVTKSFLELQWLGELEQLGVKVAGLMLEESQAFHLQRRLAQVEGNGALTRDDWLAQNPEAARAALHRHQAHLDSLGRRILCRGDMSLAAVGEWVAKQADSGVRVIAVDPITFAAAGTDQSWQADQAFMSKVKPAIEKAGASLILVSHPRKGRFVGAPTMDDLAGSAAYTRAAQCVMWLEMIEDGDAPMTIGANGANFATINRRVRILKARNSSGTGGAVGLNFDPATLRFTEAGLVLAKSQTMTERKPRRRMDSAPSAGEDLWQEAQS